MKLKQINQFHGTILAFLIFCNLWIFIKRDDGFAYQEIATYNQLYFYTEMNRITALDFDGKDNLMITVKPETQATEIGKNDNPNIWNASIRLKEGINEYSIQQKDRGNKENVELRINYTSQSTYNKSGRTKDNTPEILKSNTQIVRGNLHSLNDWEPAYPNTTEMDFAKAKKLLADSVMLRNQDSTTTKVLKIATYILRKLHNRVGIPIDSMDKINPLEQIKFAESNKSKVWCGNFAAIFSFLAANADIKTRAIDLGSNYDSNINPSPRHSFNEVFIPEIKKWVFVDLTSNSIFIKSPSGELMNTIEFYTMHMQKSNQLKVVTCINDSIKEIDYSESEPFYRDYFSSNTYFIYYFKNQFFENTYSLNSKLMRYLFKCPTYTVYSNSIHVDNYKFYVKQLFLIALLAYSVLWTIQVFLANCNKY